METVGKALKAYMWILVALAVLGFFWGLAS